jgi:hypothetical protein
VDLKPLLASLDDKEPYLKEGLPVDTAKRAPQPGEIDPGKPPNPTHLSADGASPNDLTEQRWGVIVPEGKDGDELFARVKALVELREQEQNAQLDCIRLGEPFRVPPKMSFQDGARWIQTTLNQMLDWRRPRYLLIVGRPDQVSIELQQALSVYYFVGRLAFDKLDGYSQYAAKAVEFARPDRLSSTARVLSYTVRTASGLDATDDGFIKLMKPIVNLSAAEAAATAKLIAGGRAAGTRIKEPFTDMSPGAGSATVDNFLEMARDPNPTVLMSLSHGVGRSKKNQWTEAELRRSQGMMYFGSGADPLRAEDVATGDFLPGGIWYFFACFGAGTPSISAYWHWLQKIAPNVDVLRALPKEGTAFIAALPQAALANPRGPLAVMGHLDLAWNYSYDSKMTAHSGQAQRFMNLASLAGRDADPRRVGQVFQTLLRGLPEVQSELADHYDNDARAAATNAAQSADERERATLWMLRQDLRAYILLGDPAAYLPVAKDPTPVAKPIDPDSIVGFRTLRDKEPVAVVSSPAVQAEPPPVAQPSTPVVANLSSLGVVSSSLDLDALTDAVLQAISSGDAAAAARDLGISARSMSQYVDTYKNAGRDALSRKLAKG